MPCTSSTAAAEPKSGGALPYTISVNSNDSVPNELEAGLHMLAVVLQAAHDIAGASAEVNPTTMGGGAWLVGTKNYFFPLFSTF